VFITAYRAELVDHPGRTPEQALRHAHDAALETLTSTYSREDGHRAVAYVAAYVAGDGTVTTSRVGTARAYWLSAADPARSAQWTEDHTRGGSIVDGGIMTRYLASDFHPEPTIGRQRPSGPGTVVLATDGLWRYLPTPGDLATVIAGGGGTNAAGRLADAAQLAGGVDDLTAAVVPVDGRGPTELGAAAPTGAGDDYVHCTACGEIHWGRDGAAGLVLTHRTGDGTEWVLMQLRSSSNQHDGTWGLLGGAMDPGEIPVETALREAREESGIRPGQYRLTGRTYVDDRHNGWRYSWVHAESDDLLTPRLTDESDDIRWVPVEDVSDLNLHPRFAVRWQDARNELTDHAPETGADGGTLQSFVAPAALLWSGNLAGWWPGSAEHGPTAVGVAVAAGVAALLWRRRAAVAAALRRWTERLLPIRGPPLPVRLERASRAFRAADERLWASAPGQQRRRAARRLAKARDRLHALYGELAARMPEWEHGWRFSTEEEIDAALGRVVAQAPGALVGWDFDETFTHLGLGDGHEDLAALLPGQRQALPGVGVLLRSLARLGQAQGVAVGLISGSPVELLATKLEIPADDPMYVVGRYGWEVAPHGSAPVSFFKLPGPQEEDAPANKIVGLGRLLRARPDATPRAMLWGGDSEPDHVLVRDIAAVRAGHRPYLDPAVRPDVDRWPDEVVSVAAVNPKTPDGFAESATLRVRGPPGMVQLNLRLHEQLTVRRLEQQPSTGRSVPRGQVSLRWLLRGVAVVVFAAVAWSGPAAAAVPGTAVPVTAHPVAESAGPGDEASRAGASEHGSAGYVDETSERADELEGRLDELSPSASELRSTVHAASDRLDEPTSLQEDVEQRREEEQERARWSVTMNWLAVGASSAGWLVSAVSRALRSASLAGRAGAPDRDPARPGAAPSLHQLVRFAGPGWLRAAALRYLIPRDPDAAVRRHERLGTPLVRKLVMGTFGRIVRSKYGTNYTLNEQLRPLEAATEFALYGSVFNEVLHLYLAVDLFLDVIGGVWSGTFDGDVISQSTALVANLALVALQRYSRARMVRAANGFLARGRGYRDGYRNWAGLDQRAVDRYYDSIEHGGDAGDGDVSRGR
jgi:8-oxo-dGTP pyrophosphatase MutT (NUDIX family)